MEKTGDEVAALGEQPTLFSVGGRVLYPNCTTVEGIEKKTNSETNSLAKSLAQTK